MHPVSNAFPATADKLRHEVRETWRQFQWNQFLKKDRLDAGRLSHVQLNTQRLKVVMPLVKAGGAHVAAVCTGAFVSMTKYQAMGLVSEATCPFCSHPVANTEHLYWNIVRSLTRKGIDRQMTLKNGWPVTSNTSQLGRLAEVREQMLRW